MDERHPLAEAVAVRGGRILAVGDLDGVLAAAGRSAARRRSRWSHVDPRFRRRPRPLHTGGQRARLGRSRAAACRRHHVDRRHPRGAAPAAGPAGGRAQIRPRHRLRRFDARRAAPPDEGGPRPRLHRASDLGGACVAAHGGRQQHGARSGRHRRRHARSARRRRWNRPAAGLARADRPPAGGGVGARPADVFSRDPRTPPCRPAATDGRVLRQPRHHDRAGRGHRRRRDEDASRGGRGRHAADRSGLVSALPAGRAPARRRGAVLARATAAGSGSAGSRSSSTDRRRGRAPG